MDEALRPEEKMVCSRWGWMIFGGLQRALLAFLLSAGLAPAAHAQRVALLVGNASYSRAPLSNPPNDVREMEAALTAVGFKVSKVLNANQSQLKRAVRDFGNSARGAEMALLYYSGHGTQVRGENYLIPVGANIDKESDYEIEAVSANAVLAQLREAQPRAAVVVLDACRDNPHVASTKSLTKGLARMDAPTGTMIAFATAPNDVAQDNGLYARVLAKNVQRPGLELLDVFRDTASEVRRQSSGQQVPRVSEVSIDQRIYLAGPGAVAPAGGQGGGTQVASVVPEAAPAQPTSPAPAPVLTAPRPPPAPQRLPFEPEMVRLPAGSFQMGSPQSERDQLVALGLKKEFADREAPQRRVSVQAFELGKAEVTRGQYAAFVRATNHPDGDGCFVIDGGKQADKNWRNPGYEQSDDHPVACVSWQDAQAYVTWLNRTTGKRYRLPSEAEWEYASRAVCESAFNVGGQCAHKIEASEANFDGNYSYNGSSKGVYRQKTTAVGSFKANNWGLSDMHGNVREWVQDCFEGDYGKGQPSDGSAHRSGDSACSLRVHRGGSWHDLPTVLRSAIRNGYSQANRSGFTGFRLARTVP